MAGKYSKVRSFACVKENISKRESRQFDEGSDIAMYKSFRVIGME